jgi:hypothetical protein
MNPLIGFYWQVDRHKTGKSHRNQSLSSLGETHQNASGSTGGTREVSAMPLVIV